MHTTAKEVRASIYLTAKIEESGQQALPRDGLYTSPVTLFKLLA